MSHYHGRSVQCVGLDESIGRRGVLATGRDVYARDAGWKRKVIVRVLSLEVWKPDGESCECRVRFDSSNDDLNVFGS